MSNDSVMEFPCAFPIKAMGRSGADFEALVSEIVFRHARLHRDHEVRARESGAGNFVSVTITVLAESREQLDRIYQDLTDCEQVLVAL